MVVFFSGCSRGETVLSEKFLEAAVVGEEGDIE
jgi:hypothetical protein